MIHLAVLKKLAAAQVGMRPAELDELAGELQQLGLALVEFPVVPADLVVLAIGVVVAVLGAANLVAAAHHGHALREKQRRQEIALLPLARGDDLRIVGRTFGAHVPGVVVVGAVVVVLAVGFVVLFVVADQIFQREAVVRGHEIDAGVRPAAIVLVEIAAAGEAVGEIGELAFVALPVTAHRVAIFAVPLRPQHGKVAHLVAAAADVPGLGDQLRPAR